MLIKERYLPILLSILLFLSINISSYNHIVVGKENEKEDNDNREYDVIEKDEKEDEKDFEDISINELFDNKDDDDNRDNNREYDVIEKDEKEDDVPFILPFNAVPFPWYFYS